MSEKNEKQTNEKTIEKTIPDSMKELVEKLYNAEYDYKTQKALNKVARNDKLIGTDWNSINDERKEYGVPKLSNQDMKNAYIESLLSKDLEDELNKELEYNRLRRIYEVSMKYNLEVLK